MKPNFQRILVPVDFSEGAFAALSQAHEIAQEGSTIDVLHVWQPPGFVAMNATLNIEKNVADKTVRQLAVESARAQMSGLLARLSSKEGVTMRATIACGDAAPIIIESSVAYDLVVMGTRGLTGLKRLITGSVAQRVVAESMCPVLTVRQEDKLAKPAEEPSPDTLYALFDSTESLERAFHFMTEAGIKMDDISLMMTEETHDKDFNSIEKTQAAKGAATGSILAGTVGGILGGLTSLGAATGGIGLLVMGPALAFAAAGGIFGGVMGSSQPSESAQRLQNALRDGRTLIAVHVRGDADRAKVQETLFQAGGETVDGMM